MKTIWTERVPLKFPGVLVRSRCAPPWELAHLRSDWGTWLDGTPARMVRLATQEDLSVAESQNKGRCLADNRDKLPPNSTPVCEVQEQRRGKVVLWFRVLLPLLSMAQPLYTAFVMRELWNWFVSEALHASPISYGQAFGLYMLVKLVMHRDDLKCLLDRRWEQLVPLLALCAPQDRSIEFETAVNGNKHEGAAMGLAVEYGDDISETVKATLALVIGWFIQAFVT
jgi:hypothetical protein